MATTDVGMADAELIKQLREDAEFLRGEYGLTAAPANMELAAQRLERDAAAEIARERDDFKERARMCLDLQEIAEAERDAIKEKNEWLEKDNEWLATSDRRRMSQVASYICRSHELEAERDAIRAKTIEECAKIAVGWTRPTEYARDAAEDIAEAIRALAH